MGMAKKRITAAPKAKAPPPPERAQADWVPIDSVSPDPENARERTPRNLRTIRGSLKRFGQRKPIVVDAHGIIRAGNGTWTVAKELGWSEIWVSRSHLRGAEAVAYAIADNRSNDQSQFDETRLSAQLGELPPDLVDAAGFDHAEVDELLPHLEGFGDDHAGAPRENKSDARSSMTNKQHIKVRLVMAVSNTELLERALQKAYGGDGVGRNREEALMEVCRAYLGEAKRQ
jgi:hypothetical protein